MPNQEATHDVLRNTYSGVQAGFLELKLAYLSESWLDVRAVSRLIRAEAATTFTMESGCLLKLRASATLGAAILREMQSHCSLKRTHALIFEISNIDKLYGVDIHIILTSSYYLGPNWGTNVSGWPLWFCLEVVRISNPMSSPHPSISLSSHLLFPTTEDASKGPGRSPDDTGLYA